MWENPGDLYFALRLLKGWTLAQAGQATGLAASYVGRIEHGKHIPSPSAVERLQRAYAPNAGPGLLDALTAVWSIPPRLEGAMRTAEQAMQLVGRDIGLQELALALGASWPDSHNPKFFGRGSEWALWAIMVWAGDESDVAAACATNDPARVEAAIRGLSLPGGARPDERETAAERELISLWRRLDAVGRPMLVSVARELAASGAGFDEHMAVVEAAERAFPQLGPDVLDALATLIRHLS